LTSQGRGQGHRAPSPPSAANPSPRAPSPLMSKANATCAPPISAKRRAIPRKPRHPTTPRTPIVPPRERRRPCLQTHVLLPLSPHLHLTRLTPQPFFLTQHPLLHISSSIVRRAPRKRKKNKSKTIPNETKTQLHSTPHPLTSNLPSLFLFHLSCFSSFFFHCRRTAVRCRRPRHKPLTNTWHLARANLARETACSIWGGGRPSRRNRIVPDGVCPSCYLLCFSCCPSSLPDAALRGP